MTASEDLKRFNAQGAQRRSWSLSGHVESETQTATVQSRDRAPGSHPLSPARVAGDVDEAREIPTDIVVRKSGEPDALAQMPAAAPSMTDEEAGLDDRPLEGGIQPLMRRSQPNPKRG